MALQLGALCDALMHPSDEAKANKAAEGPAGYDNRLVRLEADVSVIKSVVAKIKTTLKSMESKPDGRLSQLESSQVLICWMVGLLRPTHHYNPSEGDKPLMRRENPL